MLGALDREGRLLEVCLGRVFDGFGGLLYRRFVDLGRTEHRSLALGVEITQFLLAPAGLSCISLTSLVELTGTGRLAHFLEDGRLSVNLLTRPLLNCLLERTHLSLVAYVFESPDRLVVAFLRAGPKFA